MTIVKPGFSTGILAVLGLLGVTACGGGASTMPSQGNVTEPVAAAAMEQVPSTAPLPDPQSTALPVSPPESPPVEQPSSQEPTTPSESEATDQQNAVFTLNQDVIDNAANVGCEADPSVFKETLLQLTNASRVEARMCGVDFQSAVPVLQWNDQLAQAALVHSLDMAENNFFMHGGSDGLNVGDRVDATGYNFRAVGENIAAGQSDHAQVNQDWVESPGHCVNIMSEEFSEVGAACVRDPNSNYVTYWVVVFGDSL